jgi:DNA-directed RNA polymerase subunit B"
LRNSHPLIQSFFQGYGLVSHHIESFNNFIDQKLQQIINEVEKVEPSILPPGVEEFYILLGKIKLGEPVSKEADGSIERIYPFDARLRSLTYSVPMFLEMAIVKDDIEEEAIPVSIGNLPIMVKSKICPLSHFSTEELIHVGEDPLDPGGYFIVNGTERVLITIEDLIPNKLLLEKKKSGSVCEIGRMFSETGGYRVPHLFERKKSGVVYLSFARVKKIPIVILMRALGLETEQEIANAFSSEPSHELMVELYINLQESEEVRSKADALDYIGRQLRIGQGKEYRIQRVEEILDTYLLPHVGQREDARIIKAHHIAKMAKKVIDLFLGTEKSEDKDYYGNKRLKLAGDLMEALFRVSFRVLVNDIKYSFTRVIKRGKEPSVNTLVRSYLLTSRLESALGTGNWVGGRRGVSQHLQRLNFMDTISHLRRVLSPLTTNQPHFEARELHPTHWGKLCAAETPEGQNIGLRKNLALFSTVSKEVPERDIISELYDLEVKPIEE